MSGNDLPEILTADEVAVWLRLDRKTVYAAAEAGDIPCARVGKRLIFSRDAIREWLRGKGTQKPKQPKQES